jgi:hypothetical protein
MSKYIGTPVVNVSVDTVDVTGDITTTDTTPEVIIVNNTHEDTDGGREGKVTFKGQASGGEETTLAQIQASHDGTSDDEKGDLIFKTNDGSDGASPTEALRIDSAQNIGIGIAPRAKVDIFGTGSGNARVLIEGESGADPYINFLANNAQHWAIGIDDSDSDKFKISRNSALGTNDAFAIDTSNNVGIGTSSPATKLDVDGGANSDQATFSGTAGRGLKISTFSGGAADEGVDFNAQASGSTQVMSFSTGGSEKARLNGSGHLLVNKTSSDLDSVGHQLNGGGSWAQHGRSQNPPLYLARNTDDGDIAVFRHDSVTVGRIGTVSNNTFFSGANFGMRTAGSGLVAVTTAGALADNTYDLGESGTRWDDVRATNGTIQTSDETEKQNIASLTSAEITAATAISKLFKTYKWKDKVAAKGDAARTHTGVVAQQVQTAMSDAGLDVSKYAFWCLDTWWEKDVEVAAVEANEEEGREAADAYTRTDTYSTKDEAPDGATERTRLGVRYPELLAFIGAATEQRLTSIESRLTALEGE